MDGGTDAELRRLRFGAAVRAGLVLYTCPLSFWTIVRRQDEEDAMIPAILAPQMLLGPAARWAALAALVAAVWGHGWLKGAHHVREDWEAATAAQEAAHLVEVQRLAKAAAEIDIAWINTTTTVRERANVITKEVPVYVSAESDARCPVPVGFGRVWDADLQADLYTPAAGLGNDAASGLALSDVARGVIEAKERFEVNKATAAACQAWARAVTGQNY